MTDAFHRLYTVAEDTLDPDDNIFTRIATRVGPKYQCVPTQYLGPAAAEVTPSGKRPYRSPEYLVDQCLGDDQLPARGGDDTMEVLSNVVHMSDEDGMFISSQQEHQLIFLDPPVEKSMCHSPHLCSQTNIAEVEEWKAKVWAKPEHAWHVDYLEEAIRRFSECTSSKAFPGVRLKNSVRPRKVRSDMTVQRS